MAVIVCPICATRYRVADSQLSKANRLKCKKCKTVFPVSDNIKTDTSSPVEESDTTSQQAVGPETLVHPSQSQQTPESSGPNLGDMSLDFESSEESPSPELDFSFSASVPGDTGKTGEGEIRDHIADDSQEDQGQIEVGLGDLTLEKNYADDTEATLSMEHGLDFSFSASTPETEAGKQEGEESSPEETEGVTGISGQDISLDGLDFGEVSGEATVTLPGGGPAEPPASDQGFPPPIVDEHIEDEVFSQEEEPLSTCCIDSLAMGLKKCEICGRNLEGKERAIGQQLEQQRRQQLKEELYEGESQVSFSEESPNGEVKTLPQADEDFSDVEQALDALADGTFEKTIKKKEARKAAIRRMKMIGAAVVMVIALAAAVIWSLRPDPQEVLMTRYEEIMSQPEVDPQEVAVLFLDTVSEQAQNVFNKISVMQPMPDNIDGGSIASVGEEYEESSLGSLGKDIVALNEELANLRKEFEEKEKQWQEESALNLSPTLIQEEIKSLINKQQRLQAEFDEREAESAKKLVSLQQQLATAKKELKENQERADKYLDATDELGKATYKASVRNVQTLTDKIGRLEGQVREEESAHQKRMQEITAEYEPRFAKLEEDLQTQKALYEKAKLLQDQNNSPLIVLDRELTELRQTVNEKEELLKEKQAQLETAKNFFKREEQKQWVETNQNIAEFSHISRNAVATAKIDGRSKQKILIVLKRYQASTADQTIQGDWIVETVLQ